ncbi:MAG: DUF3365 domain-containing protein [Rhodocyclaceae bacterium]|nr:DUF3365 domain-containing protein [Rhodocyclaceae bacterium]
MPLAVRRAVDLLVAVACLAVAGGAGAADVAALESTARTATQQLMQQIGGELKREFALSGTLRSVVVCKYSAPEVSSTVSKRYGAQVRRVSLRVRNPALGTPDPWEQRQLLDFDRRAASGEGAGGIEASELVHEPAGWYYRYMKAIPVADICLNCHGSADSLTAATSAQLAAEYPHDRAVGYQVGDIRGAVSYKILVDPEVAR